MFSDLLDKFSDTFNSIKETATNAVNSVTNAVGNAVDSISNAITGNNSDSSSNDSSSSSSDDSGKSWFQKTMDKMNDLKNWAFGGDDDSKGDNDSSSGGDDSSGGGGGDGGGGGGGSGGGSGGDDNKSFFDKILDKITGKDEDNNKNSEEEEDEEKKKKGGACGGGSPSGDQAAEYPPGTSPDEDLGEVGMDDVDDTTNSMCKKTFTIYRDIPKEFNCPCPQRDNVADQFTPQDDLLTMEKTTKDFLNLEGKIYDPESNNPRFFAPEGWIQHFEKDKNVVLALQDQYKANTLRMEHINNVVDNNSQTKLLSIPNQDSKSSFQTNINWTARALKDYANNWFIKKTPAGSKYPGVQTKLFKKDHWLPGLTGEMVSWMKIGNYVEYNMRPIAIETMIRKVDMLEGLIDRLMNKSEVSNTISKFMNVKEVIESQSDKDKQKIFTSKIIDSQMGEKLGVTNTGTTNEKIEGTVFKPPKEDNVEKYTLQEKLSAVKELFQQLREKSLEAMYECRVVSPCGAGPWTDIWTRIPELAEPVYTDLDIMNELIEDYYEDYENPGKHCSVTHCKLCPDELRDRITSFKLVIMRGVVDIMTHQYQLPQEGKHVLDSMFNQLWEYSEKGPTIELPNWCQLAIDSINDFEASMLDAWDEVFDCWEREFITRLWDIEVDHHTSNLEITQTRYVKTMHNHQHPFVPLTMMTLASIGGDTKWSMVTPMKSIHTCPGHLEKLMRPVCIQYRIFNIAHLSRHFRTDIKSLCQWMCAAVEAIGTKQACISAVMSDPSLNGSDDNMPYLQELCELREKNHNILKDVEKAYGIYSDVNNMKNKKEYDEEIALHELQPNKYSNEDQINMGSSAQSESGETSMCSELADDHVEIPQLKPWNHLEPSENRVDPKPIPSKCACNKFDKAVKTKANFEKQMNLGESSKEEVKQKKPKSFMDEIMENLGLKEKEPDEDEEEEKKKQEEEEAAEKRANAPASGDDDSYDDDDEDNDEDDKVETIVAKVKRIEREEKEKKEEEERKKKEEEEKKKKEEEEKKKKRWWEPWNSDDDDDDTSSSWYKSWKKRMMGGD